MSEELTNVVEAEVLDGDSSVDIYEANGIVLYDTYDEMVERAKGRLTQEEQSLVWTRWTLGAHVKAVLDDAKYGSHKMADLEADLGMKKQTLYACKTLFETYSREDMETKVMPKNLPFRSLNYIARVDDAAKRDEYLEQVAAGDINAEDIPSLEAGTADDDTGDATGTTATEAEPKSAEEKAAAAIRKAIGAIDAPLDLVIGDIQEAENSLDNMDIVAGDDDLYDKVLGELSDLKDKLLDVAPRVESLTKRLDSYT